MKKTIAILLLVLIACMLVLVACRGDGGGAAPAPIATPAPPAAPGAPTPAPAPPEDVPRPFITVSVLDAGDFPATRGTIEDNDLTQWINEHSPVEVEFIPVRSAELEMIFTTMLVAGDAPDIIGLFNIMLMERFAMEGLLLPLDDLLANYAPTIQGIVTEELLSFGRLGDNLYSLPRWRDEIGVPNWMMFIRQDWLDNLGLDMPQTFDEFFDVMYAFTFNDPTGTGAQTFGFAGGTGDNPGSPPGINGFERLLNLYGGMRNRFILMPDGYLEWVDVTPNRLAGFEFAKRLFDAGLVNPEFFTMNGEQVRREWITGGVGVIGLGAGAMNVEMLNAMWDYDPNANPVPVPTLVSSLGQFAYLQEPPPGFHVMFPTTNRNPVASIQYMDWLASDGWHRIQFGYEDVHWIWHDGFIVPIGDAEERSYFLRRNYNFNLATPYRRTVGDLLAELEFNYDTMSEAARRAVQIRIDAINTSMEHTFHHALPSTFLGVPEAIDLLPDMMAFALQTYSQAIIDPNISMQDAFDQIVREFDALGYQEVRRLVNERARELGLR